MSSAAFLFYFFATTKKSSSTLQLPIHDLNKHLYLKIMGQKRQRDQKGSATPANKRNKAAKVGKGAAKDDSWDGIVTLDEINWKEVPMPDHLEDAEGFFGLEEIDGVDVVRTNGTGEIQFKVWFVARDPRRYR